MKVLFFKKKKKEMSLAFMNYLSINQNIWHTAIVSGILKTGLREVSVSSSECGVSAVQAACGAR